jgi:excisionase family DNA binding protein
MSAVVGEALERLLDDLVERVARRLLELAPQHGGEGAAVGRSPWMAVERAAAYLDLPKQRLYRLTASGEIPHYKQEGRLLFHSGELDEWLRRFAEGGCSLEEDRRS